MKKTYVLAMLVLALAGFAQAFDIPPDQPICKLYGIIQLFATVGGILVAAYAGFQLATNPDLTERGNAKGLIAGVVIGLIVVWIAPLLVKNLVGASAVCGW